MSETDLGSVRMGLRWPTAVMVAAAVIVGAACGDVAHPPHDLGNPLDGGMLGQDPGNQPIGNDGKPPLTLDTPWCKALTVVQKNCQSCHGNPTAAAPMSIVTYEDTQAFGKVTTDKKVFELMKLRLHDATKPMPPLDHPRLSVEDLATLDGWIDAGAQAGVNPTCEAPAPVAGLDGGSQPADGTDAATGDSPVDEPWPTDCDMTVQLLSHDLNDATKPYTVAGNQQIHIKVPQDAPWGSEDVQAIAFRPITNNKAVIHHWILYDSTTQAFLTGWAPGSQGGPLPDDVGMIMPKQKQGGAMFLDVHYYNEGNPSTETDASGVEICIVKQAKFRKNSAGVFMGFGAGAVGYTIPANAVNYELKRDCKVSASAPIHLLTSSPHMHVTGVHAKLAHAHGGTTDTLWDAPFAFEEQRSTPFKPEVIVNAGDTISTTCTFTNPTNSAVRAGPDTENEMCFNFTLYYPVSAGLRCGSGFPGLPF